MQLRADEVLRALSKRHTQDVFLTEVKTGPTWYAQPGDLHRIDGLGIKRSWAQPCVTAYEVKVSRNDFLADEKWPTYRDYCHRLYFACPSGLIKPEELAEDVGLVWFNPETGGLSTRKAALYRDITLPEAMFYHLIISRTENDRHPFFSSRREFLEAWVADKKERSELAYYVKSKMAKELDELAAKARRVDSLTESKTELGHVIEATNEVLKKYNLRLRDYNYGLDNSLRELDEALSAGMPKLAVERIRYLGRVIRELEEMVTPVTADSVSRIHGEDWFRQVEVERKAIRDA